jgi:ABC-type bacteriocin/lantibiotic exporter with double-glycine peptidase domain
MFSATISNRFVELVQNWQSLKSIQGQVARVVEVVEAPKEQTEQEAKAASQAMTVSGQSPAVKFDNVSFAYGDKPALNHVSFTVPAGTVNETFSPSPGLSAPETRLPAFVHVNSTSPAAFLTSP